MSGCSRLVLEALDNRRDAHAVADAHRAQAVAGILALELIEQRGDQPGAARTERVPERDRPAVVVDLFHVGAGFLLPGEDDRGEGFIDLEEIDVFQLQAGLLQHFRGRGDRPGQHDGRLGADDRLGHDPRPRLEPEFLGLLRRHDQDRGGAV